MWVNPGEGLGREREGHLRRTRHGLDRGRQVRVPLARPGRRRPPRFLLAAEHPSWKLSRAETGVAPPDWVKAGLPSWPQGDERLDHLAGGVGIRLTVLELPR